MEALLSLVEVVQDLPIEPVVKRDPDDDKILACAIAAQAHWIVSGDDHLLSLKSYREISILTPRQFARRWDKNEDGLILQSGHRQASKFRGASEVKLVGCF